MLTTGRELTLQENYSPGIVKSLDAAILDGACVGDMMVHTSAELTMLYARAPARFQRLLVFT